MKSEILAVLTILLLLLTYFHYFKKYSGVRKKYTLNKELFLPKSSPSWVPPSKNDACGVPLSEEKVIPLVSGAGLVKVSIPRLNPANVHTYGNVLTCRSGFRVHAYWGVNASAVTPWNTAREVLLNRRGCDSSGGNPCSGEAVQLGSGAAGLSLGDTSLVENILLLSQSTTPMPSGGSVFFDIDTDTDDALIHWLIESAVFLEYWEDLRLMHPNIRLLLRRRKGYKLAMVQQFFGISEDKVVFKQESPEVVAEGGAPDALTYFPPLLTPFDKDTPDLQFLRALWHRFITRLRAAAGVDTPAPWLPSRLIVLPRGTKENLPYNERQALLISAIADRAAQDPSTPSGTVPLEVYSYDTLPFLSEQVIAQAEARVFIVTYGSAHFFNTALARNATSYVVNVKNWMHHTEFPYFVVLSAYASEFNKIIYLGNEEEALRRDARSTAEKYITLMDEELLARGPLP